MKHIFLLFFILQAFALQNNLYEYNKIPVEFNETEFDFGTITNEKCFPITHTFHMKNISSKDLMVYQISTTCSCISVNWDKKVIKPNETIGIEISFDGKGRNGKINKSAIVYISDHKNPISLKIKGVINRQ